MNDEEFAKPDDLQRQLEGIDAFESSRPKRKVARDGKSKSKNRLIKCKDCGESVSPSAKACPHCGAPVVPALPKGCLVCLTCFGAAVIGMILLALVNGPEPTPATGSETDVRVMVWQFIESEMAPIVVDHDFGVEVKYNEGSKSWVASGSFTTHKGTFRKKYKMTLNTTDGKKWRMKELLWL